LIYFNVALPSWCLAASDNSVEADMRYSDILLHLTRDQRTAEKIDAALAVASRFKASVTALYTMPVPMPPYYMGEYVPAEFYQQTHEEMKTSAARVKAAFEESAAKADLAARWVEAEQDAETAIRMMGRTCDLVVVGQPDPDTSSLEDGLQVQPGDLAISLGRPVLTIPYIGKFAAVGRKVAVAWDGSREASRAVHDALPLLKEASSVEILTVNPGPEVSASAAALTQHLLHYGIAARSNRMMAKDIGTGDVILSTLADTGADLLVMGVYGHSRLQELVLGGVSRTVIDSMTLPVLLSN
jgi:nucleotide-binding universal stress UspA family protein